MFLGKDAFYTPSLHGALNFDEKGNSTKLASAKYCTFQQAKKIQ